MTPEDLCRTAERVLSGHFDSAVSLRIEHVMPDQASSVVARLRTVAAPSQVPSTFIVKAAHPSFPGAADMLRNDWAALRLLTELADGETPLCARFYGGDPDVPLVVMEDLGTGEGSPKQVVERHDPDAATASLLAYIRLTADLHVATRQRHHDYHRLRAGLGPIPRPRPLYHDPWSDAVARTDDEIAAAIDEYHAVLHSIGVTATRGVDDEIIEVTRRVEQDPGPFLALCQGDQNGQGGCLLSGDRLRLFDFGVSGFRHALLEGLPHRITWGCMRRVPEPVAEAMDTLYRAVFVPRLVTDPVFDQAVADAMTRWHIFHVIWRLSDALTGDRPRGPATLRQQTFAWLTAYLAWSDQHDQLTALARTARRLVEQLRHSWPPHTHRIDYLPTYLRPCRDGGGCL